MKDIYADIVWPILLIGTFLVCVILALGLQ